MKHLKNTIMRLSLLMLALMMLAPAAYSQQPAGDFALNAAYFKSTIKIAWLPTGNFETPVSYKIYLADGIVDTDDGDFSLIAEPDSSEITKREEHNSFFMYMYDIEEELEEGMYSLYLVAELPDGSTKESMTAHFSTKQVNIEDEIHILSQPKRTASVGEEYKYQVEAYYGEDRFAKFKYSLEEAPAGAEIDEDTGVITWTPQIAGLEMFTVKAELADTTVEAVPGKQHFYVETKACNEPAIITANITLSSDETPYMFTAELFRADDNGHSLFQDVFVKGRNAAGDYEIRVKFHADKGEYYLLLRAAFGEEYWYEDATSIEDAKVITVDCGDRVDLDWKVTIEEAEKHTVSGKATYEDGTPVQHAFVVFEGYAEGKNKWQMVTHKGVETDENGEYEIELQEGYRYIASLNSPSPYGFRPIYYDATTKKYEAEDIILTDDVSGIDFVVPDEAKVETVKVTGQVRTEDGNPVRGARVMFQDASKDKDGRSYTGGRLQFGAVTDADGNYEMEILGGYEYIAMAYTSNFSTKGVLFYNQADNPDDAEILDADEDLTNIDFVFGEMSEEYNASISGIVVDSMATGIANAILEAIKIDGKGFHNCIVGRTGIADENGEFEFKNMPEGEYLILAIDPDMNHIPGFYKENEIAVLNSEEATEIELEENENLQGITVILGDINTLKGRSGLGGIIKSRDDDSNISNAGIYLLDAEGKVTNVETSSVSGNFELEEVPAGDYTVMIEKAGYKDFEREIDIEDKEYLDLGTLILEKASVSSVDDDTPAFGTATPNPAVNSSTLNFDAEAGLGTINVFDSKGNIAMSKSINTVAGSNIFELNTSNFASGSYFVQIVSGQTVTIIPIVVTK